MTAKPNHQTDAETWRGGWINFYQYRGGQAHFGNIVSATREEADAVRAEWFKACDIFAGYDLVLAYRITTREVFDFAAFLDRIPDDHPNVVKVKNCNFSIAVPHVASDGQR
ncbi:hypothetical protein MBRA_06450 [Methylobacterium brachiatum]|jgi:hypothetical protein|nr:hypothetical protein MBRA_06450 [Methylobacterium brachiatum]